MHDLILSSVQPEVIMEELRNALKALRLAHDSARAVDRDMLTYLIEVAVQQAEYEIEQEEKTQARH